MTLNDFRQEMILYRLDADKEAKSFKDPYITLERLHSLYEKLCDSEKVMANRVFAEWALSESEGIRFDALAMIDDFEISEAMPTLQELTKRLESSTAPSAPYEIKKVHRLIIKLTVLRQTTQNNNGVH